MAPKKELTKCFKIDEDFERYLSRLVLDLDWSLSDVVRQSILIAAPFLRVHPKCSQIVGIPDDHCQ